VNVAARLEGIADPAASASSSWCSQRSKQGSSLSTTTSASNGSRTPPAPVRLCSIYFTPTKLQAKPLPVFACCGGNFISGSQALPSIDGSVVRAITTFWWAHRVIESIHTLLPAASAHNLAVSVAAIDFLDDGFIERLLSRGVFELPSVECTPIASERYTLIEHV
jgi:hypothetical protein